MPIMNGLEAARKLKVLLPQGSLLMFTNNAGEIMKKKLALRVSRR
jgi:CheY-like chemotaxis protein